MARADTLKGKYPAKAHAKRVAEYLASKGADTNGVIYLEGKQTQMIEDNDGEAHFRQRRNFFYLSGCDLADSYVIYNLQTSRLTLFIPPVDPRAVVWMGLPVSPEEALARYDVDEVFTSREVNAHLAGSSLPRGTVYSIKDQVSTGTTFLEFENKDHSLLREAIEECRVIKDDYELALIAHANEVSAQAHAAVMKAAPHVQNEQQLRAIFLERIIALGCPDEAYHGIFASGRNAATLHYVHNNQPVHGRLNLLCDAGCEAQCYASDITRTFPLSGRFTPESRAVYELVLAMQTESLAMCRAGVRWEAVHTAAHRVAIGGLLQMGILRGGTADEILAARTSCGFFPHGLGHYLGMDTHDTGGHADYADKDPLFAYLRVRGTLPVGSVITVEPGVYFCRFILEPMLKDPVHSKFIDAGVLEKYWDVGGVRIEDDILITKDGFENLTTVPKEVSAMEFAVTK